MAHRPPLVVIVCYRAFYYIEMVQFKEISINGDDVRGFKISDIKIGTWYTHCCHHDLYKIETQEQADSMIEDLTRDEDNEGLEREIEGWVCVDFWNTKLDALQTILGWYSHKDDIDEINKMIEAEKVSLNAL